MAKVKHSATVSSILTKLMAIWSPSVFEAETGIVNAYGEHKRWN